MGEIRNINTLVLDAMRGKLGRKKFFCFKSRSTPMLRETQVDGNLRRAERLRQSILKEAFSGHPSLSININIPSQELRHA